MNNGKRFKDTKTLITEIFESHPEWNARQVYERYLVLVGDTDKAVTLNAVQKRLETIKNDYQEIQTTGIDDIWNLASEVIPIESIPVVMEVQRHLNHGWWKSNEIVLLTVRQAKWISKIYPLLKRISIRKQDNIDIFDNAASLDNVMPWLFLIVSVYCKHQRICELLKIKFDCSLFDTLFFSTNNFFDWSTEVKLKQIDNFLDDELIQEKFNDAIKKEGA